MFADKSCGSVAAKPKSQQNFILILQGINIMLQDSVQFFRRAVQTAFHPDDGKINVRLL